MPLETFIDILATENSRNSLNILAAYMAKDVEVLKAQKDTELALKDIEILKARNQVEIVQIHCTGEINALTKSMLQISRECTSRGIFEFVLKGCQVELGVKGNFNASSVCAKLVQCK